MARTKKKRWSYSTGERGENRVRAFEHSYGILKLEFYDGGKRTRISLGHRDREKARQQATERRQDNRLMRQPLHLLVQRSLFRMNPRI